jgi:sugar lactone lactonase YvrE
MLSIACLIGACTKKSIPYNPLTANPIKPSDSTLARDSAPSFNAPAGVVVDATGNIYVTDYGNNLIRKITPAGVVSTFAGSGNQGILDGTDSLASFNLPTGITIDKQGNLFVTDKGSDLIRKITPAQVVTTVAGVDSASSANGAASKAGFFSPTGIVADGSGNLYIADAGNNAIRLMTSGGTVSTIATNDSTNDISTPTAFNNPTGVALDGFGNVYVANYLNSNILMLNSSAVVSNYADTGRVQGNMNGPAPAATFFYPNSVAVDAQGNVFVADGINNLIREISKAGIVSTFAGSGLPGAVDSTGTAASFNGPAGLAFDKNGNLYVADTNNNLIRKITPAGVVTTVAGSGLPGHINGMALARKNKRLLKIPARARFNIFLSKRQR